MACDHAAKKGEGILAQISTRAFIRRYDDKIPRAFCISHPFNFPKKSFGLPNRGSDKDKEILVEVVLKCHFIEYNVTVISTGQRLIDWRITIMFLYHPNIKISS